MKTCLPNVNRLIATSCKCFENSSHKETNKEHNRHEQKHDQDHSKSSYTENSSNARKRGHMSMWYLNEYEGLDSLTLTRNARIPTVKSPTDILVEVHAASVNPIDVLMTQGYGSKVINILRNQSNPLVHNSEFPLTLGRDFSGVIVEIGKAVKNYKVGDEVKHLF